MKKSLVLASLFTVLMVLTAAPVFAGGYVYPGCAPEVKYPPQPINLQLVMPQPKKCAPIPSCGEKKESCFKVQLKPVNVTEQIKTATPIEKVIEYTCWVPVKEKVKVTTMEKGCRTIPIMKQKPMAFPDPCNPGKSMTCMRPVRDVECVVDWVPVTCWKYVKCLKPVKCKKVTTVWQYGVEDVVHTYHKKQKVAVPCPPEKPACLKK